jgi:hypothetical protein
MRFAGFFSSQGNSRCGAQAEGRIREDERAARLVLSTEMHASENPDSAPLHSKRFQQRIRKWRNEGQRLISDDASSSEEWPGYGHSGRAIVRRCGRHRHGGASGVLFGSATSTIILAIRGPCELWCTITGVGPKVLMRSQRFMLAADQRFRAQNMSPAKSGARPQSGGFLRGAQVI